MRVVDRAEPKGAQKFYLVAVVQGLIVTMGHVLKNILNPKRMPVVFYPEQKKDLPPATRGRHRLMKREDGAPRCTACMLCPTVCPAECIHIEAGERPDKEKYPVKFEIDVLRSHSLERRGLLQVRHGRPRRRCHRQGHGARDCQIRLL